MTMAGMYNNIYLSIYQSINLINKYHIFISIKFYFIISISKDNDIQFIISGSGSMVDSVVSSATANTTWAGEGFAAFSVVTASLSSLDIKFININSEVVYTYALVNHANSSNVNDLLTSNPNMGDNQTVVLDPTVESENRETKESLNSIYVGIIFVLLLTVFYLFYIFIKKSIYKEEEDLLLQTKENVSEV
jgi:hypothetical protein